MSEARPYIDSPPHGWLTTLARLWLLRPVSSAPPGNPIRAILIMGTLWLCAWVAIDRWQSEPDPQWILTGIPLFAWYFLAILGLAALLRWRSRPAPKFAHALVLAAGAVPLPLLIAGVAADFLTPGWVLGVAAIAAVHILLFLARGLCAFTGYTQRTAALAGFAFVVGFIWLTDALDVIPDVWAPRATEAAGTGGSSVDGEAILFGLAGRIDESLALVTRGASPKPQAFFLGFAGVGDQKVFAQEIGLASRVLGERYDTAGRSLSLINDERDLERAPLATVSALAYALRGLAEHMSLERDVLFLAISSHGAQDPAVIVSNSQLPLKDLTDEDLADALRDSGIKWRVIIISACYAGGFIEALKDPQTIIIAAAAADRTSFGCSNDSDLTYFGEAFYRDALPGAHSLRDAFEKAKAAIAARERAERVTASDPQAFFGKEMEAKMRSLDDVQP